MPCLLGGTLLRDHDMRKHHQQGHIALRVKGLLYAISPISWMAAMR